MMVAGFRVLGMAAAGILLALLTTSFEGCLADWEKDLLEADSSCEAFASLSITEFGGVCTGTAKAACKTVKKSRDAKKKAFRTLFTTGVCDVAAQKKASEDLAASVGAIWLEAFTEVKCEGQGFGCGFAVSDTAGWGFAFAQMLYDAAEEVIRKGFKDTMEDFCLDDLLTVGSHLGESGDGARAEACESQKEGKDFKQKYITLASKDIQTALQTAAVVICGGDFESECLKPPEAEVIVECGESVLERCCTARMEGHGICICPFCHNPLHLDEDQPLKDEGKIVWVDSIGDKCYCEDETVRHLDISVV